MTTIRSLAVVMAVSVVLASGANMALAGVEEVRGLVGKGEYQAAVKMIAEELRRDVGDKERYELLSLRGECLIQLGQRGAAITAFEQASRSAPDRASGATARATMALLKKSGGDVYRPKGGGEAIGVKAMESRKAAMGAFASDLASELGPKVERAAEGNTLPPMINLLPSVLEWAAVEYAATGSAGVEGGEAQAAAASMGKRARELMVRDLRKSSYRLDEVISQSEMAGWWGGGGTVQKAGEAPRRSLTSAQEQELKELRVYVKQIGKVAGEARKVAREQEGDVQAWNAVVAQATDLLDRVDAILGQ